MPDLMLPCGALLAAALIGFGLCTLYIHRQVKQPLEPVHDLCFYLNKVAKRYVACGIR